MPPRHIVVTRCFVAEPDIQTRAAYILLRKQLAKLDVDNHISWLRFRDSYLKARRREAPNNLLECVYCGKSGLRISPRNPNRDPLIATIDHIIPPSKGGKMFDEENLVVACITCNSTKADKSLNVFFVEKLTKSGFLVCFFLVQNRKLLTLFKLLDIILSLKIEKERSLNEKVVWFGNE